MVYRIQDGKTAEALFAGWEESLIWSCLRGTMGYLYADAQEEPHSAMAILGDFVFFAGKPNRELAVYKPDWCTRDFIIAVPQGQGWADVIEDCWKSEESRTLCYEKRRGCL